MARLEKGYQTDVGHDVLIDEPVSFAPGQTTVVNLHLQLDVPEGYQAYLCSRTSAAKKGLIVIQCPIDPGYTGDVHAIVANVSGLPVYYKTGEAFCQVVVTKVEAIKDVPARKKGKRSDGRMGSTGANSN